MSSAKNKVISSIYVSEHMIKKINKETKAIYDYVNNNLANKINCVHRSFVLSGWAKADSAFIITDEDSADFPDYITNRKFEIRAIITYKDCPIPVTYSMSFDWRNTDWQHIALPVNLELKEVVSIECVIDYSHNTGSIDFTNLELKQGDYEKTEYNSDNLPIKKSSGHSEWTTSYKYDENHNLICEIITSNTTATEYTTEYEYNKLGKLIKATDYSGIIKEYVYNDKGSIIKTLTYHKDEPANILCEEKMLDDNGNETYTLNEFGEKVSKLEYIDGTGIQSSTINNDETKTAYGYDKNDTLLQTSTTINNTENTNIYGYTLDAQTSLTHNNFDIKYSYDDQGRKTKIQIADTEYLNKIYGEFEEVTYLKTGESYKQTFDKNGNVLEVYYKPALDTNYSLIIQNIYDIYGTLIYSKDLTNGTEKIRTYSYDNFGQVISEENTQHEVSVSVVNEYDDNHSTIDHATIDIDGTKIEYDYGYSISPDSKLERITSPLGNENIYYDKLGRVNKTELSPLTKEFTYLKKGSYTSNLVSKINFATNNIVNDNLTYKYDEKGNITEIRQYNKLIARYKYDALSRIVREDNKEFSTTTTFVYDAGGNILCKKIYNFTVVENLDLEKEPQVITYTYPISGWRDQLLEFNGEKFEYDNLGNPTKYRNKTLLWSHGRQLDKFSDIAEFKYNANGIRTSKYANGFTTKYYLNGNKIIRQQDASNDMYFYYGTEGLTGFKLNGTNYYYKKNLQNDIIGIIDTNGEEIVKYVYNAWGNHKAYNAKTNDLLDISCYESYINTSNVEQFIASKNPFRYRSYYYDFETGLYYLNSRYYDPETGRFINADDINAINVTRIATNGLNLYCYCLNNPVNEVDESGYFLLWLFITAIVVGAVVGATTSIVSQGVTNGWNNINWLQVGWDALIGGISGALSVTGLGVLGMTIAGATIGFVSSVGSNLINGSDFGDFNTWLDIGISTGLGAFFGFIGGAGATNTKGIDSAVRNSSQFMKAAASYDKVLTKIANGAYKTLAGAAGARAITVTTLRNAWQTAVIHSAWKSFGIGLIYNIFSSGAAIIQSIIMKNI